MAVTRIVGTLCIVAIVAGPASRGSFAQAAPPSDKPAPPAGDPKPPQGGGAKRFFSDVVSDYRHFFTREAALTLSEGAVSALAVHAGDEALRDALVEAGGPGTALKGGQQYGAALLQFPLAAAWWGIAAGTGSSRHAAAGRDLMRAQISAATWTYGLKYAVNRTRPNGDPRSFPSGHASATFATSSVLLTHYGWKIGAPAFAAAAYTAASRIGANKHWGSDVVMGTALGLTSGRAVSFTMRHRRATLSPSMTPGGGGVQIRVGGR